MLQARAQDEDEAVPDDDESEASEQGLVKEIRLRENIELTVALPLLVRRVGLAVAVRHGIAILKC